MPLCTGVLSLSLSLSHPSRSALLFGLPRLTSLSRLNSSFLLLDFFPFLPPPPLLLFLFPFFPFGPFAALAFAFAFFSLFQTCRRMVNPCRLHSARPVLRVRCRCLTMDSQRRIFQQNRKGILSLPACLSRRALHRVACRVSSNSNSSSTCSRCSSCSKCSKCSRCNRCTLSILSTCARKCTRSPCRQ